MYEKYKKPEKQDEKDPGYMERMNKIAIQDTKLQMSMSDQVTECMKETNLTARIDMLKEVYHKVHRASKPYINFLIKKYTQKRNSENSW